MFRRKANPTGRVELERLSRKSFPMEVDWSWSDTFPTPTPKNLNQYIIVATIHHWCWPWWCSNSNQPIPWAYPLNGLLQALELSNQWKVSLGYQVWKLFGGFLGQFCHLSATKAINLSWWIDWAGSLSSMNWPRPYYLAPDNQHSTFSSAQLRLWLSQMTYGLSGSRFSFL